MKYMFLAILSSIGIAYSTEECPAARAVHIKGEIFYNKNEEGEIYSANLLNGTSIIIRHCRGGSSQGQFGGTKVPQVPPGREYTEVSLEEQEAEAYYNLLMKEYQKQPKDTPSPESLQHV